MSETSLTRQEFRLIIRYDYILISGPWAQCATNLVKLLIPSFIISRNLPADSMFLRSVLEEFHSIALLHFHQAIGFQLCFLRCSKLANISSASVWRSWLRAVNPRLRSPYSTNEEQNYSDDHKARNGRSYPSTHFSTCGEISRAALPG